MSSEDHPLNRFTLYYEPYTFRGAARPHGFKFCLRLENDCFYHGIIFGPLESIARELPEPIDQWAKEGHLPYLPADRPIGHLGACARIFNRPVMYIPKYRDYRRVLPASATEAERRIHAARVAAQEKREQIRPDHV